MFNNKNGEHTMKNNIMKKLSLLTLLALSAGSTVKTVSWSDMVPALSTVFKVAAVGAAGFVAYEASTVPFAKVETVSEVELKDLGKWYYQNSKDAKKTTLRNGVEEVQLQKEHYIRMVTGDEKIDDAIQLFVHKYYVQNEILCDIYNKFTDVNFNLAEFIDMLVACKNASAAYHTMFDGKDFSIDSGSKTIKKANKDHRIAFLKKLYLQNFEGTSFSKKVSSFWERDSITGKVVRSVGQGAAGFTSNESCKRVSRGLFTIAALGLTSWGLGLFKVRAR